jgi:hypothetical protein
MNLSKSLVVFALSGVLSVPLFAQPEELSLTRQPGGNGWLAAWAGVAQRTYFLQKSSDLHNWSYAPCIEFGTGQKTFTFTSASSPRFFTRLHHVDDPAVTNLEQARAADFDGDGVSNFTEISHGFDPMNASDSLTDTDGDGLTNQEEAQLGSNPNQAPGQGAGSIGTLNPTTVTQAVSDWSEVPSFQVFNKI